MTQSENSRMMIGLRKEGWSDTKIEDFILWVETGDEQYAPKSEKNEK